MSPVPEGEPVTRPAPSSCYLVVARSAKVAAAWNKFVNQANNQCAEVYDVLETEPDRYVPGRQHPLRGDAGRGSYDGVEYVRHQIDVTSGGRVWYFIDKTPRGSGGSKRVGTVIIDEVHLGHPKSTERNQSGKRRPGRK